MSQAQPQPDVKLLNYIFNQTEKKQLDEVTKHRVHKTVQAFKKTNHNYRDGLIAQAEYYIYFNEYDNAIHFLHRCLTTFKDDYYFVNLLAKAYQFQGNFKEQINLYLQYFDNLHSLEGFSEEDISNIQMFIDNSINICLMFLIKEESVFRKFLSEEQSEVLMSKINKQIKSLESMNISLETYQKFVAIINSIVYEKYFKGFMCSLRIDPEFSFAEFSVLFKNITVKEAFNLNRDIDDAILNATLDDERFADEVINLSVNCTLAHDSTDKEVLA